MPGEKPTPYEARLEKTDPKALAGDLQKYFDELDMILILEGLELRSNQLRENETGQKVDPKIDPAEMQRVRQYADNLWRLLDRAAQEMYKMKYPEG